MPSPDRDWEGVRLHVVTGKGGTGKTTVAAALALALAREGQRVLLAEVEGRQGIAQLFDVPPLPYDERKVAVGHGGGEVFGLVVDPKAALLEYLQLFYKLGRAGNLLERFGAVDFATTIAPGIRDVLLTGKVYEAVRRRASGRGPSRHKGPQSNEPAYDAVVLDAPPTGRIVRFLDVNTEVVGLARVGPIRNQADSITRLLRSPADGRPRGDPARGDAGPGDPRRARRSAAAPAAARRHRGQRGARAGAAGPRADRRGGRAAGPHRGGGRAWPRPGCRTATASSTACSPRPKEHGARVALEKRERTRVKATGRPVYELPALSGGVDLGGLYELARILVDKGMA